MSQDDDVWVAMKNMIPTMDSARVIKLFEDMIASKNKKIADLQKALHETTSQPQPLRFDEDLKEKASDEVQELAIIRTKLEKFKRINKTQYDNLVKFTDASTATIHTRGDDIAERRRKLILSFQYVWNTIMPKNKKKTFTSDDESFSEMLSIIKHLVKEDSTPKGAASAGSKKNEEDYFKEQLRLACKVPKD